MLGSHAMLSKHAASKRRESNMPWLRACLAWLAGTTLTSGAQLQPSQAPSSRLLAVLTDSLQHSLYHTPVQAAQYPLP